VSESRLFGQVESYSLEISKPAVIFPSGVAGLKQLNVISLSGVIRSLLLLHWFKVKVILLIPLGQPFDERPR
jgi:hypothetical protein